MSQPLGRSFDPQSPAGRHLLRRPHPRPHASPFHDPVSTRRPKPLLTGGNIVLFVVIAAYGLYASGHFTAFDRFFDHLHAFARAHNDFVVHAVLYWLPGAIAVSAGAVLAYLSWSALRARSGRRPASRPLNPKTLRAAMANISRSSAQRAALHFAHGIDRTEAVPPLAALADRASVPASLASVRPDPIHREDGIDPMEAERLRRDALSAAHARATAAGQTVPHLPPPVPSLSDSTPTLPAYNRVRRRHPRGTLPPAVAAALKLEVAAYTR